MESFQAIPKPPLLFHLTKINETKNDVSDFRPVSILKTFFKVYEKVIKDELVSGLAKYFYLLFLLTKKVIVLNMS